MRRLILVLSAVALHAFSVFSQTTSGSIVGTVTDSTGAAVPSATVTITNLDTSTVFKTQSDATGNYVATPLQIGIYSVTVEATGFKKAVSTNIKLNVQDRLRLDFGLQIGAASDTVTVSDAAPVLQTESSDLGQVVENKTINDLPLNGRFITKLAVLTAGVVPTTSSAPDSGTGGFSANGVRPYQNNYILDGVDNNNMQSALTSGATYVIMPPPDAVAEFKLQTNSMSAEFGRSAGGVMNVSLKSGTQNFRGSVFEFLRNSALDAKNYFDSAADPIPAFKQNQFGGTFGGPLRIPGLKRATAETFFFGDYQGTRIRRGETIFATVPLPEWSKSGDFSGALEGVQFNPIFDPATTTVDGTAASRQQFPDNQVPLSRFDPVSLKLFNDFPAPNVAGSVSTAGVFNNFLSHPQLKDDADAFDVRIDHKASDRDSIFFRFSFKNETLVNPGSLPPPLYDGGYLTGTTVTEVRTGVLAYTRMFTSRTVNEARVGYVYNNSALRAFNTDVDGAAELGIPGIPFTPGNGGLPTFSVTGINGFGGSGYSPTLEVQTEYMIVDTLSLVRGSHTLKVGGEMKPVMQFSFSQPIFPRGSFNFSGGFTKDPNDQSNTGLGAADFALGIEQQAVLTTSEQQHFEEPAYFAFLQDDYKVNQKLTLNLGVRYEFVSNAKEKNDLQSNFNLTTKALDIPSGITLQLPPNFDYANIPVNRKASRTLVPDNFLDFAPRVGFAYSPWSRTVLSGGFGTFYSSFEAGPLSDPNPGLNPPFHAQSTFTAPSLIEPHPEVSQLSEGFPDTALTNPDTASFFAIDPQLKNPYVMDWNLSVQRELGANMVLNVAYAGSRGNKQYEFRNANQPLASADPTAPLDPRRPMPYLGQGVTWWCSCGFSDYHALQTKLDKRFSSGLTLLAAYTYGKTLDEASQASFGLGSNGSFRDSLRHPGWEKGPADYDVRQRFVLSYSYALPFGHGKPHLQNLHGLANVLVDGWEFVGIDAFQTGFPFTISSSVNSANSTGQTRPDVVQGVSLVPQHQGPLGWYNLAALQPAALGAYGTFGRNALEGPGQINVDFSVFKTFKLGEDRSMQFRSEFFNIINHPNFQGNSIQLVYDQPGAGQISAANASRQIQFGLKVYF